MAKFDLKDLEEVNKRIHQKQGLHSWKPQASEMVEGLPKGLRARWLRSDDKNVAKKQNEGWEILKYSDKIKAGYERDGAHSSGDRVLAVMPEEKAQAREKFFRDMQKQRLSKSSMEFTEELKKIGVRSIENEKHSRTGDPRE